MFALLLAIIYLSFISLGLPDSLLGSAWPVMYAELGVPVSYMGIISVIICAGTIVSSLLSDLLTKKLGTGLVTALSVLTTAAALFGFSVSTKFWMLIVFAIPYGLGAGGVDASLNNYVALHFKSRHMSWLHCMWGLGASISPYIMGYALSGGHGWDKGYLTVSLIQFVLAFIVFISLPLWKKKKGDSAPEEKAKPLSVKEIVKIRGAIPCFIAFFCYCSLEQTTMLWASSFMVFNGGISADTAASFASMFFIGITAGRAVNGFLTFRLSDKALIRAGQALIFIGIILIIIPAGYVLTPYRIDICGAWVRARLPLYNSYDAVAFRCAKFTGYDRSTDGKRLFGVLYRSADFRINGAVCFGFAVSVLPIDVPCADGCNA